MNITDGEMGLAHAMGGKINSVVGHAQAIVDRKNIQLGEALVQIENLQVALLTEQAHTAGLAAEVAVLKQALNEKHDLLQKTGRKYNDGHAEIRLHLIYQKNFDDFVTKLASKLKGKIKREISK